MTRIYSLFLSILVITTMGCSKYQVEERVIFLDSFEPFNGMESNVGNSSYTYLNSNERYFNFNGSRNLGRFERGGIILKLSEIEEHDFVRISFDLYIHDKWEGNGERGNGEDVFIMNLDGTTFYFSSIINTKCQTQNCNATQSFPNIIGTAQNPENAEVTNPTLPGVCHFKDEPGGSKLIKIVILSPHLSTNLNLTVAADIKDAGADLCLKSWSIDNLKISSLELPERG